LTDKNIRNMNFKTPKQGIGQVEAPRGTLIHHYETNEKGMLTKVNLIVATLNNSAGICMSIEKAARAFIKEGKVNEGLLNMVEMAYRAYDPCLACATHSLTSEESIDLTLNLIQNDNIVQTIERRK
ncbi:MAG: nickel-dependent hydrogenase large subunit, partial [Planctomycetota bacterium]